MAHHRKHGALEVTADFQHVDLLFAGPTRIDSKPLTRVVLHVRNNTEHAVPFTFNSTPEFEIELVDGKVEIVSRWSQGREFAEHVSSRPLEPHTTWTFDGELPIPQTRSGDYTVRIYVMAEKRIRAESLLHVTFAP